MIPTVWLGKLRARRINKRPAALRLVSAPGKRRHPNRRKCSLVKAFAEVKPGACGSVPHGKSWKDIPGCA